MDTLVSVGTLAAFGWSLWALFFGDAGMPGMRHGFELTVSRTDGAVARSTWRPPPGSIAFILAGRYLEARVQAPAGAALRALMELGAKDVTVLRGGREVRDPGRPSWPSATASSYGPGRRSPPTAPSSRAPPRSTPPC